MNKHLQKIAVTPVRDFKLQQGYAAETSGGLLMSVHPALLKHLQQDLDQDSWVIGEVKEHHTKDALIA